MERKRSMRFGLSVAMTRSRGIIDVTSCRVRLLREPADVAKEFLKGIGLIK